MLCLVNLLRASSLFSGDLFATSYDRLSVECQRCDASLLEQTQIDFEWTLGDQLHNAESVVVI